MKISFTYKEKTFISDLEKPIPIGLPLRKGDDNPNCYYADPVEFQTIRSGEFIGSVKEGGSVNYQKVTFTPHGNGTHTECHGHINDSGHTINKALKKFHFFACLMTVAPEISENGDQVIKSDSVVPSLKLVPEALILRTIPNDESKLSRRYSNTNPPYPSHNLLKTLATMGVEHFLTDLPSVDKEVDGGKLLAHHNFWQIDGVFRDNATITELIFVDNKIADGFYLLNLQVPSFELDAAPSAPILYKVQEI